MVLAFAVVLTATKAGFRRVDSMAFFLLSFNASRLRRVGRPTGGLNAELLCVLGTQSLPAVELHGLGADHASDRSPAEKAIQHVEADVPARGAPRDEAATDAVPQR